MGSFNWQIYDHYGYALAAVFGTFAAVAVIKRIRITSYNVCYTKLLRTCSSRPIRGRAQPIRPRQTTPPAGAISLRSTDDNVIRKAGWKRAPYHASQRRAIAAGRNNFV